MSFGTEILFMLVLGLLLLGPKRLPTILGHAARAKAQFERAARSFKSQVETEIGGRDRDRRTDSLQEEGARE